MKIIEINNDFATIEIHISDLDHIADLAAKEADKETERSKGFFTRNAGAYNRIAQKASKAADEIRKQKIYKKKKGDLEE